MPNVLSDIQSFLIFLLSVPVLALMHVLLWVLVSALMLEPDTGCVQDYRRRSATSNVLRFLIKQNRLESVLLQGLLAMLLLQMSFPDMGWVHTHPTNCAKLDSPCAQWTVGTIVRRFCRVADTDVRCNNGMLRLCPSGTYKCPVTCRQICCLLPLSPSALLQPFAVAPDILPFAVVVVVIVTW